MKPDGSSVRFRSRWEFKVAKYLDAHLIAWEYEKHKIPVKLKVGKRTVSAIYIPDFYLPELKCFWEVKGWWRNDKSRAKVEAAEKQHKLTVKLIMEEQMREMGLLK